MKERILSAVAVVPLCLFVGFSVGMGAINLFPHRCVDGSCFTLLGWVGWEATTGLGVILGGVVGIVVAAIMLLWPQKQ